MRRFTTNSHYVRWAAALLLGLSGFALSVALPPLGLLLGLALAFRASLRALLAAGLTLLPLAGMVALGTSSAIHWYHTEGARHGHYAHPNPPMLHPEYRVFSRPRGCLPSMFELSVVTFEALVLPRYASIMGPPRGAYLGPFPSADAIPDLLQGRGRQVSADALEEGLVIGERVVHLPLDHLRLARVFDLVVAVDEDLIVVATRFGRPNVVLFAIDEDEPLLIATYAVDFPRWNETWPRRVPEP